MKWFQCFCDALDALIVGVLETDVKLLVAVRLEGL